MRSFVILLEKPEGGVCIDGRITSKNVCIMRI
jgi:hypothetical protein